MPYSVSICAKLSSLAAFTDSALIFDTGDLLINDTINNGVTVVGTGGNLTNTGTLGTIAGLIELCAPSDQLANALRGLADDAFDDKLSQP